jgi:predicted nucleic acid-binding protein
MELAAAANDASERKRCEQLFHTYRADNELIVPSDDDWLLASKVLHLLTQSRRRSDGGKLRRLDKGVSQRMALDALIAISARRCNVAVVTENWKDFKLIQRFCNVKIIKAVEFFR